MCNSREKTSLTVPAEPRYARVVRMLAANLATIDGMTLEEVEDVRMAAEEAFVLTCASGIDEVEIDFILEDGALVMEFEIDEEGFSEQSMPEAFLYADLILQAVCDEYEHNDSQLRLVKRAEEAHETR